MISFVEIIPASAALLPPACRQCDWYLRTTAPADDGCGLVRAAWMEGVSSAWGSVGLAAVDNGETLAAIQFAPVAALPRAALLAPNPPAQSTLLFCLRYRSDQGDEVSRSLLHRALALLRERGIPEVHVHAVPLGDEPASGNLMGLEFLRANGFYAVGESAGVSLMHLQLRGLVPVFSEAARAWRFPRRVPVSPTPAGG